MHSFQGWYFKDVCCGWGFIFVWGVGDAFLLDGFVSGEGRGGFFGGSSCWLKSILVCLCLMLLDKGTILKTPSFGEQHNLME